MHLPKLVVDQFGSIVISVATNFPHLPHSLDDRTSRFDIRRTGRYASEEAFKFTKAKPQADDTMPPVDIATSQTPQA